MALGLQKVEAKPENQVMLVHVINFCSSLDQDTDSRIPKAVRQFRIFHGPELDFLLSTFVVKIIL